jgi:ubiquinone/menaquinone biosynthesis C-methylase UbiE
MDQQTDRVRRKWNRMAGRYERGAWGERLALANTRELLCARAHGRVLEVAIGTGRSLEHYPPGVEVTGVDLSPEMLAFARRRAAGLTLPVRLVEGDAQCLEFADAEFDTVMCALSLCTIPDQRAALAEMWRVLKPGGTLLLVDHIEYTRGLLRRLEHRKARPRRRPADIAEELGFDIEVGERIALGFVERVIAHRPAA